MILNTKKFRLILDRSYYENYLEIIDWCNNQFKLEGHRWSWTLEYGRLIVKFDRESDMNWFLLKWKKFQDKIQIICYNNIETER